MISLTSPVETWAHRWPAGIKLGALCGATVVLFSQEALAFHALVFAGCLLLYCLPGAVFFKSGIRRLVALWPFVALILIWHVVTGAEVEGLVVTLRLLSAVALANLVTMTTRLSQMIEVIKWLSAPLRKIGLNTRALEIGIALVVRFTPALIEKGGQLAQSWSVRSHKKPSWKIVMPFTVLAIDDAEHVADALKARGGL
ncbi:energy-coupling factor transporter transmembrane component T family protein [Sedimentitalea todarodis]|uniref:Energy-coupling factor transporter transmembrane component T n=1 Tax=Sedimentitalea todarodis TaxID=1631240 RepID=A0ABU3VKH5_9RHOB|nr:energy-coupling factor transporter transmembrane component T [Sedimentitalea todarodis]MDU9006694.1 energy-coupling factor transporter transmembrane component T [Sedimentitalea todarodis]